MGHHGFIRLAFATSTAVVLASASSAQTIYRCVDAGKILYTTVPCDAGTVVVAPHLKPTAEPAATSPQATTPGRGQAAPTGTPATDAPPRPGGRRATAGLQAARTGAALRGLTFDAAALERACRAGERRACDVRACLETSDMGACARAEGKLAGATWRELSRITQTLVEAPTAADGRPPRETAVTIECVPGGLMRTVYLRHDLSAAFVRDGDAAAGLQPGRTDRRYGTRFPTIEDAAAFVCASLEATQPFE